MFSSSIRIKNVRDSIKYLTNFHHRNLSTNITHSKYVNKLLGRTIVNLNSIQSYDRRNFIGFVSDKKEGYRTQKEETRLEHMKHGFGLLKNEFKMWTEEMKEKLRGDPPLLAPEKGNCNHLDFWNFCLSFGIDLRR